MNGAASATECSRDGIISNPPSLDGSGCNGHVHGDDIDRATGQIPRRLEKALRVRCAPSEVTLLPIDR